MKNRTTTAPEVARRSGGTVAAVVGFARALRSAGLEADVGAVLDFARALSLIDVAQPEQVRCAGATLFVRRREDFPVYHTIFERYWLQAPEPPIKEPSGRDDQMASPEERRDAPRESHQGTDTPTASETGEGEAEQEPRGGNGGADKELQTRLAYSAAEALRHKSFELMTPDEQRDADRLVDHLRPRLQRRQTRRYRLHRRGALYAPRAMLRRSLTTGGNVLTWLRRRRTTKPRPLVALCDISGSMEPYSRFALRFVHALTRVDVRTESFVFGTRLTRITPELRWRDTDEALSEVTAVVQDWAGGTQIGTALKLFNRRWARRVLRTSTIVIVVSDGWDRGEPAVVASEMALLRRRCHRVIWLNPLVAAHGYEPRTGGMVAALPYVDDFLPIADVSSLERLAEKLAS